MGWYKDAEWKTLINQFDDWFRAVAYFCEGEGEDAPSPACWPATNVFDGLRDIAGIDPFPINDVACQVETWLCRNGHVILEGVPISQIHAGLMRCRMIRDRLHQLGMVEKKPTPDVVLPNDARNEWAYDQLTRKERGALVPQKMIMARLKTKCAKLDWALCDISTLKRDANRWAQRNGKPPIAKRKHGRKPSKR